MAWAKELRAAGYRTAILSNMPPDTLRFIRASDSLRFIEDFDVTVYSCDYALIKPDARLFRICLDLLGAAASECLFVDDNADNVDAARALGFAGIRFLSNAETARDAAPCGVPVESLLRA
jgi:FMN phosphatase YigB (HAD superfamily)